MKTPSQPRAIYYIVAIQIWEYFSFYGMRALLILYLTHQLGFDDSHAISLFSAYASLVYVTPILGGWLADRLLGNRTAVIAGALLMTLGHVVLGVESTSAWSLYVALAIIICGYGLFKSISAACSANCTLTTTRVARRFLAAVRRRQRRLDCRAHRLRTGGAVVRLAYRLRPCGIGMFIGLMIFLSGSRHFRHTRGVDKPALRAVKFVLPTWGWLLVMLCLAPVFFTLLLQNNWSGYLLAIVCLFAAQMVARIMIKAPEHRRALWQIVLLMLAGTLFWCWRSRAGARLACLSTTSSIVVC